MHAVKAIIQPNPDIVVCTRVVKLGGNLARRSCTIIHGKLAANKDEGALALNHHYMSMHIEKSCYKSI